MTESNHSTEDIVSEGFEAPDDSLLASDPPSDRPVDRIIVARVGEHTAEFVVRKIEMVTVHDPNIKPTTPVAKVWNHANAAPITSRQETTPRESSVTPTWEHDRTPIHRRRSQSE